MTGSGGDDGLRVMPAAYELPSTVRTLISPEGIRVLLMGSTHVSFRSVEEAQMLVRTVRPRVVFLELCRSRMHLLNLPLKRAPLEEMTVSSLTKAMAEGGLVAVATLLISHTANSVADRLGIEHTPGAEFIAAFQEAHKYGGKVALGDRDVNVTLMRSIRALNIFDKLKIGWSFLTEDLDDISREDIENLTDTDVLTECFEDLSEVQPRLLEPLVHERDRYMCYQLRNVCTNLATYLHSQSGGDKNHEVFQGGGATVVAVVGMGHVAGIVERWEKDVDFDDLRQISLVPPELLSNKITRWLMVGTVVAGVAGGGYLLYKKIIS